MTGQTPNGKTTGAHKRDLNNLYQVIYYGDSQVEVGKPFSISCIISIANPVEWHKDGEPIRKHSNIRHGKDEHSYIESEMGIAGNRDKIEASISVQRALPKHQGKYQCNALYKNYHQLYVYRNGTLLGHSGAPAPASPSSGSSRNVEKHHDEMQLMLSTVKSTLVAPLSVEHHHFTTAVALAPGPAVVDEEFPGGPLERERDRESPKSPGHSSHHHRQQTGPGHRHHTTGSSGEKKLGSQQHSAASQKTTIEQQNTLLPDEVLEQTVEEDLEDYAPAMHLDKSAPLGRGSAPTTDVLLPNYDQPSTSSKIFDIGKSVTLGCNITQEGNFELSWAKDGKNVSEVESLKDRYKVLPAERKFIISRALETDAGQYTCSVPQLGVSKNFNVVANVVVKFESTEIGKTNIVEGERLTLHCIAFGTEPRITWIVGNNTYNASTDHIVLEEDERGIENAKLIIESITLGDYADYTCEARNNATDFTGKPAQVTITVRIRGKYAALYVFLGIIVEVVLLCAIILICEKRRNKTEIEESDTDQSPDHITLGDYADYTCEARNNATDFTGKPAQVTITVRIRGKYAALYVFLGIIVEVVLLCAIILICEKRRNKTEIEESDTDQSPDQNKNGYHGNESELRQRK
uniref:Ig-like domain-containing protein n=1 Tax=Anopheles stephensi TaxID=30069 RepID=A0A182YDS4_ANOST